MSNKIVCDICGKEIGGYFWTCYLSSSINFMNMPPVPRQNDICMECMDKMLNKELERSVKKDG